MRPNRATWTMMMNGGLSLSGSKPRLGLIGNPENRRIVDFQAAAENQGYAKPICLSYERLLSDLSELERFEVDLIRIDSPGENAAVTNALIALGGGPRGVQQEFGEISFLREYHRGFCTLLQSVGRCAIPCVNSLRSIALMFDKWKCHEIFIEHEIERPDSELAPKDVSTFLEQMMRKRSGSVFLKPLHGSSASGVCALRWNADRTQLIAPIRLQFHSGRARLINSLTVQTYRDLTEIEVILRSLLPQGMIMERWIPKLTLPGGPVDLRVLVIA